MTEQKNTVIDFSKMTSKDFAFNLAKMKAEEQKQKAEKKDTKYFWILKTSQKLSTTLVYHISADIKKLLYDSRTNESFKDLFIKEYTDAETKDKCVVFNQEKLQNFIRDATTEKIINTLK